jgi:hypothetical protein
MLNLMNKSIPAALTENQSDLFINLFLKTLRIRFFNVFDQLLQLPIYAFSGFQKPLVETGKDFDLNDIAQVSPSKAAATPHTGSCFRLFHRFPSPFFA